jgi:hypothetical protein
MHLCNPHSHLHTHLRTLTLISSVLGTLLAPFAIHTIAMPTPHTPAFRYFHPYPRFIKSPPHSIFVFPYFRRAYTDMTMQAKSSKTWTSSRRSRSSARRAARPPRPWPSRLPASARPLVLPPLASASSLWAASVWIGIRNSGVEYMVWTSVKTNSV